MAAPASSWRGVSGQGTPWRGFGGSRLAALAPLFVRASPGRMREEVARRHRALALWRTKTNITRSAPHELYCHVWNRSEERLATLSRSTRVASSNDYAPTPLEDTR